MKKFKAIIIGGTGATGQHVIHQLLNNENCTSVTSIGRTAVLNGITHKKLKDVVIESLFDLTPTEKYWQGHDVYFNCIGTTRHLAGGAKPFINIEYGISREAARMAEKAKIPYASLISAKGADHKIWALNWIHPLLYMKTMGLKEQTVISEYQFKSVSVFKPGMLIRLQGEKTFVNKYLESKGFGLRVDMLASAMVIDVENIINNPNSRKSQCMYIGNESIKRLIES